MQITFSKSPGKTRQSLAANTSTSALNRYLQDIGRIPLLGADEEIILAQQIKHRMALLAAKQNLNQRLGHEPTHHQWAEFLQMPPHELKQALHLGQRAKRRMIEANLRLVVSIAKKYQHHSVEILDLIQEGSIGLERAVEKFDPTAGYRFSTYGYWWIRQAMTRAISQQSRTIRLPGNIVERLAKIRQAQQALTQSLGRDPTLNEIAQQTAIAPVEIRRCLQLSCQPLSLERPVGQFEDGTLKDLVIDPSPPIEDTIAKDMLKSELRQLVELLPPKQKDVITLRFGLQNGKALTLDEVGEKLYLSRERIRQIQNAALGALRRHRNLLGDYLVG